MKGMVVLLVFVVGCRFDLPEVEVRVDARAPDAPGGIDAPGDVPAARCPAEYMPLPGGPAGRVYWTDFSGLSWIAQRDFCAGTSPHA